MRTREIDERLTSKLRERGQRVTSQRVVIHRALAVRDQHLSAEQVHEAVSDSLPGTSLPTVYATLELFEHLGLVRRMSIGSGPVLFDSRVAPHAHSICQRCGLLADVEEAALPTATMRAAARGGFRVDHAQVIVWGTCTACQNA